MNQFLKIFLILLAVLFVFVALNPYYLNSLTPSTILSRHDWQDFSNLKNKKILAGQTTTGNFKATNNRLGAIEIEFSVFHETTYDSLLFKIKEKGARDWYYQGEYNNIAHGNVFFPFGFPVITDSRRKTYEFELTSTSGTEIQAFALSQNRPYFLSRYSFPLSFLNQNKKNIPSFAWGKITSFFSALKSVALANYLFIFLAGILIPLIKKNRFTHSAVQTIFIDFFNQLCFLVFGIFLFRIFLQQSEKLEWTIYEITAVGLVISSFLFNQFLKNKISSRIFNQLLNFYFLSFAAFVLLISLTKNILPRHLLFLLLSFIPLIKTSANFLQILLINLIGIFSVLGYFNRDFPGLSPLKLGLIFFLAIVFYFVLSYRHRLTSKLKFPSLFWLTVLLLIILYVSQKPVAYQHYSFFLGPAMDILKGKSLLGDTPSQYGYLSIHLLAAILNQTGLSLANFHLINILLFVGYYFLAGLVFLKLIKNRLLSFASAIIFISLQTVFSHYNYALLPSTGPLRFGLGLLIIWLLAFFRPKISFIFGSLFSAIALFWSIETAVYVVPAWVVTCLLTSCRPARKLLVFLLMSSIIGLTILLKEYLINQTFPRVTDYFEFANAYKDGFGALPIPIFGNFYLLIIIMFLGIVTAIYLITQKVITNFLPLLIFSSIYNVAIFSYFISRSHENNVVNISGFFLIELVIILKIFIDVLKVNFKSVKTVIGLPLILFIILFTFRVFNQAVKLNRPTLAVFQPTPSAPVLSNALIKYRLEGRPIVLLSESNDTRLLIESNLKNELPLNPAIVFNALNPREQKKYLDPALTHLKIGTVIIIEADCQAGFLAPIFAKIQNLYQLNKIGTINQENLDIYQVVAIKAV